ncbi:MAG: tetratricopeptide repeat protein [bacterium]|jgi:tetratricopeptide (TPR) repeat protein
MPDERNQRVSELFDKGVELYNEFKLEEAISVFTDLLENYSEEIPLSNIHQWLGLSYAHLPNYDLATKHLLIALDGCDTGLDRLVILDKLGYVNYAQSNYTESLQYYNKAESLIELYNNKEWYSNHYLHYLNKGRCKLYLGEHSLALQDFERALGIVNQYSDQSDSAADANLLGLEIGIAAVYTRQLEKADAFLSNVNIGLLDNTCLPHFYFNRGKLGILRKNYALALENLTKYEKLGVIDENKAEAYCLLGVSYYHTYQDAEAKRYFTMALEYPAESEWIHEKCSEYLQAMNKT